MNPARVVDIVIVASGFSGLGATDTSNREGVSPFMAEASAMVVVVVVAATPSASAQSPHVSDFPRSS